MPILLNYEPEYPPCANCGDEWSQTVEWSGRPLCEECYNAWHCGCDACVKVAVATGLGAEVQQ